jgi:hypothetical protein
MTALLISFLIFLVIVCVVTALVAFILDKLGLPFSNFAWALAGIIILIWVLEHLPALEHAL